MLCNHHYLLLTPFNHPNYGLFLHHDQYMGPSLSIFSGEGPSQKQKMRPLSWDSVILRDGQGEPEQGQHCESLGGNSRVSLLIFFLENQVSFLTYSNLIFISCVFSPPPNKAKHSFPLLVWQMGARELRRVVSFLYSCIPRSLRSPLSDQGGSSCLNIVYESRWQRES